MRPTLLLGTQVGWAQLWQVTESPAAAASTTRAAAQWLHSNTISLALTDGMGASALGLACEAAAENAARISDLQHQLKENEAQRTEITGYSNQLSIQLHRWQLRFKTLHERQAKLETELGALTGG